MKSRIGIEGGCFVVDIEILLGDGYGLGLGVGLGDGFGYGLGLGVTLGIGLGILLGLYEGVFIIEDISGDWLGFA